jgi:putative heme-binding domain-containing protein
MSDSIESALKQQLTRAEREEATAIIAMLLRAKVSFPGLTDLMLAKSGGDTASFLDVIGSMLSTKTPVSDELIRAISTIATAPAEKPELRARALRVLSSGLERNFLAARDAFLPLAIAEQPGPLASAWEEFTRDPRLARRVNDFANLSRDTDPARRILGATVLVNLAGSTILNDRRGRSTAQRSIDRLWQNSEQTLTLLTVIGRTRAVQFAPQIRERLADPDRAVADAAKLTLNRLGLDPSGSPTARRIGEMEFDEVVRIASTVRGDARLGEQLFLKQSCIVCHTVSDKEPPKGPMLGGIGARYSRVELIESIIRPNAKIAQGFQTQAIATKQGDEYEGFVVKEGGDSLEVRTMLGVSTILEKADITKREKREQSIMPTNMVDTLAPEELASLLAFLEGTSK